MDLLNRVRAAGVVGAGGAGFPTHVKLEATADYILLNGAECEPLLRVDQQLMALYPQEILMGLEAAGRRVNAKKALLGIKGKHQQVIQILQEHIEALHLENYVEIKVLPDVYPAGDEQVLVYELTGRVVPEMGIPLQVGCVVINSETALNIYRALQGEPVIEKYLTITGEVPNPMTVKVPVGTPVVEVLQLSGVKDLEAYAVIDGGPMMGPVMAKPEGYITKRQKGFILLKKDHPLIRKKTASLAQAIRVNRAACEQCRMCTDLCPRYLLGHGIQPHKMMNRLNYALPDLEGQKSAQLCCQCNLCELFSCPAGLYPRSANVYFKEKLTAENLRYQPQKTGFTPHSLREYRMLPSKRLVARLGLSRLDQPAPLKEVHIKPAVVRILTRQHVGAPAMPTVSPGDQVVAGQQIGAIPGGHLGAVIHSSISGTVTQVEKDFIEIRGE